MRRTIISTAVIITGLLACPCHLPLTLPLLLAVLGGTAAGAFLVAHTGWIAALSTGYFLAAMAFGFWSLSRPSRRVRRRNIYQIDAYPRAIRETLAEDVSHRCNP